MAWTITVDFESGVVGNFAQPRSSDGFDFAYPEAPDTPRTLFDNTRAISGSQSAKFSWNLGDEGHTPGGEIRFPTNLVNGDEYWVRWYSFFPTGFNFIANPRLKYMRGARVWRQDGTSPGYLDMYIAPSLEIRYDNEITGSTNATGTFIERNQWICWEMYVFFSPTIGTARIRFWKNGVLFFDYTGEPTLENSTDYSNLSLYFTYWNGGCLATQDAWSDAFIYTSDPATASNFDASGNRMIGPIGWSSSNLMSQWDPKLHPLIRLKPTIIRVVPMTMQTVGFDLPNTTGDKWFIQVKDPVRLIEDHSYITAPENNLTERTSGSDASTYQSSDRSTRMSRKLTYKR